MPRAAGRRGGPLEHPQSSRGPSAGPRRISRDGEGVGDPSPLPAAARDTPEVRSAMSTVNIRYLVDDVSASVAFYTTHLGFAVDTDAAPAFASVTRESLRLLLSGDASSGARPMP